jgi:putative ABC transport system ATP-binding protein
MSTPVAVLEGVSRTYGGAGVATRAVEDVTLSVEAGSALAIVGPSGAGKSTLLHLLGALDKPTSGRVLIEGRDLGGLSVAELAELRRRRMGFVFQLYNLLPQIATWQNIALPLLIGGVPPAQARSRAAELAALLGIERRLDAPAGSLSGGEMQRAAIGRALSCGPALVLADEPTGSLDSQTGSQVLDLLYSTVREAGGSLVLVTHDRGAAERADRVIEMVDGRVAAVPAPAGGT